MPRSRRHQAGAGAQARQPKVETEDERRIGRDPLRRLNSTRLYALASRGAEAGPPSVPLCEERHVADDARIRAGLRQERRVELLLGEPHGGRAVA
jgi:hypothetical protein